MHVEVKENVDVYEKGNSSSSNMFTILESVAEREGVDYVMLDIGVSIEEEKEAIGLRKSRTTSAGVADLMKTFKLRKK